MNIRLYELTTLPWWKCLFASMHDLCKAALVGESPARMEIKIQLWRLPMPEIRSCCGKAMGVGVRISSFVANVMSYLVTFIRILHNLYFIQYPI